MKTIHAGDDWKRTEGGTRTIDTGGNLIAMTEIWSGPTAGLDTFLGTLGVNHPDESHLFRGSVTSTNAGPRSQVTVPWAIPSSSEGSPAPPGSFRRSASGYAEAVPIEQHPQYLGRITQQHVDDGFFSQGLLGAPVLGDVGSAGDITGAGTDGPKPGIESYFLPAPTFTLEFTDHSWSWSDDAILQDAGKRQIPKIDPGGSNLSGGNITDWLCMGAEIDETVTGGATIATIRKTWVRALNGWDSKVYPDTA